MPRPKQRTPELREELLRVALELLESEGVHALTTRRLAEGARTSPPAVYELFGDKAGVVRGLFFEGFRLLYERFVALEAQRDPRGELLATFGAFRAFTVAHPELARVMFSRPFPEFAPSASEREAGARVRAFIVARVQRCIDEALIEGPATDVAHVLLALAQGLALQESGGWLGSSRASVERRFDLALDAMLRGLRPRTTARR